MAVELRGVGRGKIVRDEEVRAGDRAEIAQLLAHEVSHDTPGHVANIQGALAQVRVVDLA